MMAMSAELALIYVIGFLSIVSVDARWFRSRKTKIDAKTIPEDCSECGIIIPNKQRLIRGGAHVNKSTTYPWMVSLRADEDYNNCNGAIIDKFHILTAAHCFENDPEKLKVYFQTKDLKELSRGYAIEQITKHPQFTINESETGEVGFSQYDIALVRLKEKIKCDEYKNPICLPDAGFKLSPGAKSIIAGWGSTTGKKSEQIIKHPQFATNMSETGEVVFSQYDIAKVRLKEKIKCDEYKNPICLPDAGFKLSPGSKSIIAGWGSTTGKKSQSEELQQGFIKNLDFNKCVKEIPETKQIKDFLLCQGSTKSSPCYGDSGAPLMHKIKQKYYAVGITSSTTNIKCSPERPAIYTDVVKYLDWIKKKKKASLFLERKRNGKQKTCEEIEIEKRREQHRKEEGK